MGQIHIAARFCKILLEHSHTHSLTYCLWLLLCFAAELSIYERKMCGLQSLYFQVINLGKSLSTYGSWHMWLYMIEKITTWKIAHYGWVNELTIIIRSESQKYNKTLYSPISIQVIPSDQISTFPSYCPSSIAKITSGAILSNRTAKARL